MSGQDLEPDQPSPDSAKPKKAIPVPVQHTPSDHEREMTSARREMMAHLYAEDAKKRRKRK